MNKKLLKLVEKECQEVLANILVDLCQMDKRNEERILILLHKH